ncbi:MAG: DUF2007 domain-containing protein [Muribaculaceae bacterium]|nr:DUF2007 domain-containing protein [Muribaculaceae bacterium]
MENFSDINNAHMVLFNEYNTDFEANIVKSLLQDAGIECALTGEYAKYSFLNEPVKLFVHNADLERARELVKAASVPSDELEQQAAETAPEKSGRNIGNIILLIVAVLVAIATIYYIFSWQFHF